MILKQGGRVLLCPESFYIVCVTLKRYRSLIRYCDVAHVSAANYF